jgi:hypothetical protein
VKKINSAFCLKITKKKETFPFPKIITFLCPGDLPSDKDLEVRMQKEGLPGGSPQSHVNYFLEN